jgi:uncharacterized protein YkwD
MLPFQELFRASRAPSQRRPQGQQPQLEGLEERLMLSIAPIQPTPEDVVLVQRLNAARADPAAYGRTIGVDLSGVAPSQPLAFDARLNGAAQSHSLDEAANGYADHFRPPSLPQTNPPTTSPSERIGAAGYPLPSPTFNTGDPTQNFTESIESGSQPTTPEAALQDLITDAGHPDLGHRTHLLATNAFFQESQQIGVGIVHDPNSQEQNYYTIETAFTSDTRPFLTGAVFNDSNGNGLYDIGEGLGGVSVQVFQGSNLVASTTTGDAGAYQLQLDPGTYTVTFSGGRLPSAQSSTVTLGTQNVQQNLVVNLPASAVATKAAVTPPAASGATSIGRSNGLASTPGGLLLEQHPVTVSSTAPSLVLSTGATSTGNTAGSVNYRGTLWDHTGANLTEGSDFFGTGVTGFTGSHSETDKVTTDFGLSL